MVVIWAFVVLISSSGSIMPAVLRMLFHDHPATTAEVGCIPMYYLWMGIPGSTGCTHIHIDTVCKSTYWWRVIYVCTSYVYCRRKHDDTCAQPTNHLWFHHSSTKHNQTDIENDLKMIENVSYGSYWFIVIFMYMCIYIYIFQYIHQICPQWPSCLGAKLYRRPT